MAKNYLRKEIMLSKEEVELLRFAMRHSGLDMTTTMRWLMRMAVIALIIEWKRTGVPKLPADLAKLVEDY